MDNSFTKIQPENITDNTFKLIDKDWMLITAGRYDDFNTMTASWGGMGILWHKQIAICFIRPQRYTFGFAERYDHFTLSFFPDAYRKILTYCGTYSGKEVDKIINTGLIPLETESGNIFYEQAKLVVECKKIYFDDLKPDNFLDPEIQKNYPINDYHRMYIGEIMTCYKKE